MSPTAPHYPPPLPPPQTFHSPPITIVLSIVLLIFFLLGFFSIYFCRCFLEAIFNTWNLQRTPSGNLVGLVNNADVPDPPTGLSPMLIRSFPTLVYSSIKEVRSENYDLECAICLVEFEDDSLLRLLTVCYHVFHQECVDLWLESHKTCPVCRRDLEMPHVFPEKPPEPVQNTVGNLIGDAVAIDVREENCGLHYRQLSIFGSGTMLASGEIGEVGPKHGHLNGGRFPRSHSTGHSIARARSEEEERDQDRYRLRLPEHVKIKFLRGHHWTGSCETYVEFHRRRYGGSPNAVGRRFGEVSGSHH